MTYSIFIILWFTIAIPAVVGMVFFNRLTKPLKIIAVTMLAGLATEILLRIATNIGKGHFYVLNAYTLFEVILLTMFFNAVVSEKGMRKMIRLCGLLATVCVLAEAVWGGPEGWNSFSTAVESVFIIVTGFYYCYEVARGISPDSTRSANFWFTVVLMFYFMSSLEYFLLSRFLAEASRQDLIMLGTIHTFINAFCNVAYGLILWKSTRSYSLAR